MDYGIISWWDGHRSDTVWQQGFPRVSVDIMFDNGTGFRAWGHVPVCPDGSYRASPRPYDIILPLCDATNALLDYFEGLEAQLAELRETRTVLTITKWTLDSIDDWEDYYHDAIITVQTVEEGDEIKLYALGMEGTILIQEFEDLRVSVQSTGNGVVYVHDRMTSLRTAFYGRGYYFVTVTTGPVVVWRVVFEREYV